MEFETLDRRLNYPSRCQGIHIPVSAVATHDQVVLRGRLVEWDGRRGELGDQTGRIRLNYDGDAAICTGDIVEVSGISDADGEIRVSEARCLAPCLRDHVGGDWLRFHEGEKSLIERLNVRSRILSCIRHFFSDRDYIEVETPHLLNYAGCEEHIEEFETTYRSLKGSASLYLATSPELYMKRLLGVGLERFYQLGRCFRNGERSSQHNPEFTMVEWYQAYASYEEIMEETEELVASIWSKVVGRESPLWKLVVEERPWRRISVREAFEQWVGVDIGEHNEREDLYTALQTVGFTSAVYSDTWDDLFNKALLEKVEPQLALLGPVFLYDYPIQLGAMAKGKEGDGRWAERAELYLAGTELANGYTELNDPVEQRGRFNHARSIQGGRPLDEQFLKSMERAIPPAGGMALGVDRLVMLATEAGSIDDVLTFPMSYLS